MKTEENVIHYFILYIFVIVIVGSKKNIKIRKNKIFY